MPNIPLAIEAGQRFGRLVVTGPAERRITSTNGPRWFWPCRCDCGASPHVEARYLVRGRTRSCGCAQLRPPINIGDTFGRLTVIARGEDYIYKGRPQEPRWRLRCECGNEAEVRRSQLNNGHTKSCGCLSAEKAGERTRTHGASQTRTYRAHKNMIQRCTNPANPGFHHYGGRGITVCQRWRFGEGGKTGFECFYEDMGPCPSEKHSLDRRDNSLGYGPENCRWTTQDVQTANSRRNVRVLYNGEDLCLQEACRRAGVNYRTVQMRRKMGWSEHRWFEPPDPGAGRFR